MRQIAEMHIGGNSLFDRLVKLTVSQEAKVALILGIISALLYYVLYLYSNDIVKMAIDTNNGHKIYSFVPIIIAFIFSVVHGKFTERFWDALGVKAKR